jgi:glutamate-5-semialdehyde dehydrogenase
MENRAKAAAIEAKKASHNLMGIPSVDRNRALRNIAQALSDRREEIFTANRKDLIDAKNQMIPKPLVDRLVFDEKKLADTLLGIKDLSQLADPLGNTTYHNEMDTGLDLYRVTCPIGVIGVIFESRPDALVQISTLCLKSGNAVILKGGSEAEGTNRILKEIIGQATDRSGIPHGWIQLIFTRDDVMDMLVLDDEIDLLIPRGSNSFVRYIMNQTKIPVLGHADGVCHIYIDEYALGDQALEIIMDAKTQYVSACNATETLLIHERQANNFLERIRDRFSSAQVEIFGCPRTCDKLGCQPVVDWHREYLDYQISIRIVRSLDEAIQHINQYGSKHTDSILTEKRDNAKHFMNLVDSANVFWNCSTRFSDGFRFGFGAEVGISTSKIHARGPVGLEGLVTYKYKLFGHGQTVSDYAGGSARFIHKKSNDLSPFDQEFGSTK